LPEEKRTGAVEEKAEDACSHASGFLHGDAALRNIVMKPDVSVQLIDLGSAKSLDCADGCKRHEAARVELLGPVLHQAGASQIQS